MDAINWGLVLQVAWYVLTVVLFFLSVWLKNDRDLAKTKEAIAKMIGDALAAAAAFAGEQAASVTDEQLDNLSGGVYDYWVPRLPDGLPALVMALYPKPQFQALFRKIWRQYNNRSAAIEVSVARQL